MSDGISFAWSPGVHLNICDSYRSTRALLTKVQSALRPDGETLRRETDTPSSTPTLLSFSLSSRKEILLAAELPKQHRIEFRLGSAVMDGNKLNLKVVAPRGMVSFDGKEIFVLENLAIEKAPTNDEMEGCRKEFKDLNMPLNRVLCVNLSRFSVTFPYKYDFAAAFEEATNTFKWLKLIHEIERKPFTLDSPLPSDLKICVKEFHFQLNDDPFEVKLRDNYELLLDEANESERRRQMLETKLEELRRNHPLLPRSKTEELYASLLNKNAGIYIERSKQMGPSRTHLISWRVEGVEMRVVADSSLHGKDNVLKLMKTCNPESPAPPETAEFLTMWARGLELDFENWLIEFRDYPQPYMLISEGHVWGKLAGVEQLGADRSTRSCSIHLDQPWGSYQVLRNMPPLKFFYDLSCDVDQFNVAYGPCWEPCLAMINLCFNYVNHPSLDPSIPLPFWDKIRLLLHGRLSMFCQQLTTVLLASPHPYNTTEQMEIAWEEFAFDWTTGLIKVTANVDAFVRTASKYDDIRLLHLPDLKLSIKMDWSCLGDRHDHSSVSPCAPDKLPQFTLNQEHDSYRAFRSQHLNVALGLEVKQPPDPPSSDTRCPQMLLYNNTFRFLELLKILEEAEIVEETASTVPPELTRFYELAINRMNDIIISSGSEEPGKEVEEWSTSEKIPSSATPSILDLLEKKCICRADNAQDLCRGCRGKDKKGVLGHHPWDELEMKKHGWMNEHGQHWGTITYEDDLLLLRHGILNKQGGLVCGREEAKKILEDGPLRSASTDASANNLKPTTVTIGKTVEVVYTDENVPVNQPNSEDLEIPERNIKWNSFTVGEGGEMTTLKTELKTATLFCARNPSQLIYLERGDGQDLLIQATR